MGEEGRTSATSIAMALRMRLENEVRASPVGRAARNGVRPKATSVLGRRRAPTIGATLGGLRLEVVVASRKGTSNRETARSRETPRTEGRSRMQVGQEGRSQVPGRERRRPLFMPTRTTTRVSIRGLMPTTRGLGAISPTSGLPRWSNASTS